MSPFATPLDGQSVTSQAPPVQSPVAAPIAWDSAERAGHFQRWLLAIRERHGLQPESLRMASADASFRRYFRIDAGRCSRIVMDAPPDKENCAAFDQVARLMTDAGLHVPHVLEWDRAHGFMLLSDLGTQTMLQALVAPASPEPLGLYLQAVESLVAWQRASEPGVLPPYDEAMLLRECELFAQWYLGQHHRLSLDDSQRNMLDGVFRTIVRENLSRSSVFVHRDFMPRNLMLAQQQTPCDGEALQDAPDAGRLGVLDFQDAVFGPVTYDIASLMRDAFLSWDEEFVLDVTIRYWEKARAAGLPVDGDFGDFYRGVEWMGLQRHLKVCGIFARLTLRDGKPRYLADTPRFIGYIRATASRYRELAPLLRLIDQVEGTSGVSGYAFGRI